MRRARLVFRVGELNEPERRWLDTHFMTGIFPVLTPLAVDPAHPFPFIPNFGLALALQLVRPTDDRILVGLLPLPAQIARFISLPGGQGRFMLLEKLVTMYLDKLFPGFEMDSAGAFRVIRDSDIEILEESMEFSVQ